MTHVPLRRAVPLSPRDIRPLLRPVSPTLFSMTPRSNPTIGRPLPEAAPFGPISAPNAPISAQFGSDPAPSAAGAQE